jgi:hypothetical protein
MDSSQAMSYADRMLWGWPLLLWGPFSFGCVVGWLTHSTLTDTERVDVKWLGAILGVIGGGGLTTLLSHRDAFFAAYSIGLGITFFARAILVSSDIAGLWQRLVERWRNRIAGPKAPTS